MSKNIKIFISCHKRCNFLKNKYISPIQVGAALSSERFEDMEHDDEGENISILNPMYCELTAQYWAWKNIDADYYGFMHYRRYFSLNSAMLPEDCFGNIVLDNISDENIKKLGLDEENIEKIVPQYDIITLIPNDLSKLGAKDVYAHAKDNSPYHRIEDFDEIIEIIQKKYPEYFQAAQKYLKSDKGYFCNMYILKKELFQKYSEWLFDILETHRKSKSFSDYSIDEYRVSGFWAERLWGIFYTYLKDTNKNLKCKEVQKSFFEKTDDSLIKPVFLDHNIPVVFAADNNYVPIISTAIKSLLINGSPNYNYDIIILQQNITDLNQQKMKSDLKSSNASIRFFDVKDIFKQYNLNTPAHFTIEIYFRLAMPDIMKLYDKVIYLDSDLIINADLSELYKIPIGDNLLGAVQDVDSAGCYKGFDPSREDYFNKYIKLKDPYSYFNSGVLIMNLKKFRETYTTEYILKLAEQEQFIFPDQDVLNILCEGKVYYLDESWNTMMNHQDANNSRLKVARFAPHSIYQNYLEARKHPYIVHYAGYQKPWVYLNSDMSEYFWKYARQTIFWEELMSNASYQMYLQKTKSNGAEYQIDSSPKDYNGLKIDGLQDSLYLDGIMIKFIAKMNKIFPIGSKRRDILKKIAAVFVH